MMDKLYFLQLDETIDENIFNQLFTFLSEGKQKQIKHFRVDIDKKLCMYSELLIKIIASQALDIEIKDILIEKERYGKPYLKGYKNFHFNISHTRNAIIVAVSRTSVGVDIEKIRKAETKIAKRFFTQTEQSYVSEFAEKVDKRFYEIWTKKEAHIKYIGEGLKIPLRSFDVFNKRISKQIQTFIKEGYIISICNKYSKDYEVVEINQEQIESIIVKYINKINKL